MSLEHSFRRLALRPSSICNQCRRTFATSTSQRQRQNATAAFAADLQSQASRNQTSAYTSSSPRPAARPTSTADSLSAASTPPADHFLTETPSPTEDASFSLARKAIHEAGSTRKSHEAARALLDQERGWNRADLERQMVHRRWKAGDVYAPHDLTGAEMAKWKKQRRKDKPKYDVLDQLKIKPMDYYKNFSIMSEYMTEMGRIKHSNDTNLRPVNQRRMAKAIRRAIGLGILMPSTHRHPELLRRELEKQRGPAV